jgi:hypothetical protein
MSKNDAANVLETAGVCFDVTALYVLKFAVCRGHFLAELSDLPRNVTACDLRSRRSRQFPKFPYRPQLKFGVARKTLRGNAV